MQCSVMREVQAVASTTPPSCGPSDDYRNEMCKDWHPDRICGDDVEGSRQFLDTLFAEVTITSSSDYLSLVKEWQSRRAHLGASSLVLQCTLLGPEAQILRQKFSLKRNTRLHLVFSDAQGTNWDASPFRDSWKREIRQKAHTITDPIAIFTMSDPKLGNLTLPLEELTLENLLIMYVPTIFAEFYAHSLSALMNSLHTFTPFLDRRKKPSCSSSNRVRAPSPTGSCCLGNAVTHSQRTLLGECDQALYDSANLVASQLYHGIASHLGPEICAELERRGSGIEREMRIGLEDETVPFRSLYVARGGEVELRRGEADEIEIVLWTSHGNPQGGEFVVPGFMYKFDTGQGSTILFRPNRFYHATLPPENRDTVNEKFAVALVS